MRRSLTSSRGPTQQLGDLVICLAALLYKRGDPFHGVDDGCVVAPTELVRDRGITEIGELSEKIHADLPGRHKLALAASAPELLDRKAELGRCGLQDLLWRNKSRLSGCQDVREQHLGQLRAQVLPGKTHKGGDPDQCAFEAAYVVSYLAGD
jgi:hypothetical protein